MELEKKGLDGTVPEYEIAVVRAGLGDRERTLQGMERAVASFAHSTLWMQVDYRLDELREEPRFKTMLRTVGLRN